MSASGRPFEVDESEWCKIAFHWVCRSANELASIMAKRDFPRRGFVHDVRVYLRTVIDASVHNTARKHFVVRFEHSNKRNDTPFVNVYVHLAPNYDPSEDDIDDDDGPAHDECVIAHFILDRKEKCVYAAGDEESEGEDNGGGGGGEPPHIAVSDDDDDDDDDDEDYVRAIAASAACACIAAESVTATVAPLRCGAARLCMPAARLAYHFPRKRHRAGARAHTALVPPSPPPSPSYSFIDHTV
jgi:hypothetical protein